MKKIHFLLVASILCLPFKTFALDVVDTTWEDVSPVTGDRSNYQDFSQKLYSTGQDLYLARYENERGVNNSSYTFAKITTDNTWEYLFGDYTVTPSQSTEIVYGNSLFFDFFNALYRIDATGLLTAVSPCTTALFIDDYLYTSCGGQIKASLDGASEPGALQMRGTQDLNLSAAVTYSGKQYFFGSDSDQGMRGVGYLYNSDAHAFTQIEGVAFQKAKYASAQAVVNADKLYVLFNKFLFVTSDGTTWHRIHRFASDPEKFWLIDGTLFLLQHSHKDHQYYIRYSADGQNWSKMSFDGFSLKRAHYIQDGSYYLTATIIGTNDEVVIHSSDGLTWQQVGQDSFRTIKDIQPTDDALYIVTEHSKVYRTAL